MKKVVLISCVSMKLVHPAPAAELYVSPLFKYNMLYAKSLQPDLTFILSAKYGLLSLDQVIEPYNVTLKEMSAVQARAWAELVLEQLAQHTDFERDHFIFLAGALYRKHLLPRLRFVEIPMQGKPIGKQLQFLKEKANE